MIEKLMKLLHIRMSNTLIIAMLLLGIVALISPIQLGVVIAKLALATIGAALGYWIDRELFPYARPGDLINCPTDYVGAQIRRAIIVAAIVIGVTLGL